MSFFAFRQNNSGGEFLVDKKAGIAQIVIVEADSFERANDRAESIGLYFDGVDSGSDCPCCGDRWDRAWVHDAEDEPRIYGEPITAPTKWTPRTDPEGFVHYADGRVESFTRKTQPA